MIRFGPMSIVLLCGALYGVMRAAMLCFIPVNRAANALLAALILVLALAIAPYVIGYAGYYDAYPWLSFAPYKFTLAIGPLLYLIVHCTLASGARPPRRWLLHLLPALVQLLYYGVIFMRPLAFKNAWDAGVHRPYVDPAETVLLLASLAAYLAAGWRSYLASGAPRSEWLRNLLVAMSLTGLFWAIASGADRAGAGLTYFQRFPLYMWLAIVAAYLGTEGYRQGAMSVPAQQQPAVEPVSKPPAVPPSLPDQAELGQRWRAAIVAGRWWRDPELSLASLARRLGTNSTALSRAFNEGLGLNFNEVINRLRVEAVVAAMRDGDEQALLDLALAEGFNSKASFNRAFKLYTGETPTAFRQRSTAARASQMG